MKKYLAVLFFSLILVGGAFGLGLYFWPGEDSSVVSLNATFSSYSMYNTATTEQVVEKLVVKGTKKSGGTKNLSLSEVTVTKQATVQENTFDYIITLKANAAISTNASIRAVSVPQYLVDNMVEFLEGIADEVLVTVGEEIIQDVEWGFLAQTFDINTRLDLRQNIDGGGTRSIGGIALLNNNEDAQLLYDFVVNNFPNRMYGFAYQNFFLSFGVNIEDMIAFAKMFNINLRDENLTLIFDVMDDPEEYINEFLVLDGLFNTEKNITDSWWIKEDNSVNQAYKEAFGVSVRFANEFIGELGGIPGVYEMGGIAITDTNANAVKLLNDVYDQYGEFAGFGFAYKNIFCSFSFTRPWIRDRFMALLFITPDTSGVTLLN